MSYYGNPYSGGRGFLSSIPPVVKNIIIINVLVYLFTAFTGNFMYEKFSLFYVESPWFKPYQFISHMFMHGGFFHLFFNMYTLFFFGSVLERIWGGKKFFIYYMLTGLGAACLHELVMYLQSIDLEAAIMQGDMMARTEYTNILRTPTVGASGAIYGLLLAYGMMFPNNVMQMIFPPIALKAKWFVIIFGVIELSLGLSNSGGNIAHFAHLGGMLFGLLIIYIWKKQNKLYN